MACVDFVNRASLFTGSPYSGSDASVLRRWCAPQEVSLRSVKASQSPQGQPVIATATGLEVKVSRVRTVSSVRGTKDGKSGVASRSPNLPPIVSTMSNAIPVADQEVRLLSRLLNQELLKLKGNQNDGQSGGA